MNIRELLDIFAGGPGSGCNPEVGHCGRPEGSTEAKPSDRAAIAKANHVPITKEKYQIGMEYQARFAKAIGAKVITNNHPFDVVKGKIAFEVKTVQASKKDRVEMRPDSRLRKEKEARRLKREGGAVFTVAYDLRAGKEAIYIKEGVGAFRFGAMTRVTSEKELASYIRKARK